MNVIGNHDITCQLTTGLGSENKIEDHSSSSIFVLSKKFTVTNANLRASVMLNCKILMYDLFMTFNI